MPSNQFSSKSIEESKQIINNNYEIIKQKQLDWDKYFLEMLELVKKRSPDKETKVACILTENNRVISTGYNGLPSGLDNLDCTRPGKYKNFLHSEQNAICNLLVKPVNPTAYITHYPCNVCLKMLWQIGCRRIVVPKNRKFFSFSEDDQRILDLFRSNGLELVEIDDNKFIEKAEKWFQEQFRTVRVGRGISQVSSEHFGDFE